VVAVSSLLRWIQQCFIDIQNRYVRATDELSRLVIETAGQRPVTLKDFRTQELALDMQTRIWGLSKFQPIGTHQEEIAKKSCSFQIREEGIKLNSATQNAIGFALSRLLDTTPGDAVTKLNIKKVFATCREKYCSINGAPIRRLTDEGMRKERAMLAQAATKSKVPFGNRNGRPDKSDRLNQQFAKLKKELTLAQREIANLKNQLNQAKENMAKERHGAGRSSKSKKEDSPDDEFGVREPVNKLSVPRHRNLNRDLHHRVRHGRDS
jgi:hypothetical protein